jgi:hypothetical protein
MSVRSSARRPCHARSPSAPNGVGEPRQGRSRPRQAAPDALGVLIEERRKLLRLHYADQIDADLFAEEQCRLTSQINALRAEETAQSEAEGQSAAVAEGFEEIAAHLAEIDVPALWDAATEDERRVLLDELLDRVEVYGDHLEVIVRGAPRLNVTMEEAGLRDPKAEKQPCRRGDFSTGATRFPSPGRSRWLRNRASR